MHLYYDQWQNMQCSFKYFEQYKIMATSIDSQLEFILLYHFSMIYIEIQIIFYIFAFILLYHFSMIYIEIQLSFIFLQVK